VGEAAAGEPRSDLGPGAVDKLSRIASLVALLETLNVEAGPEPASRWRWGWGVPWWAAVNADGTGHPSEDGFGELRV